MRNYFEAYKGDAPYAFISYSHIDSEMVYPVIKELNDEGYRIWYDEGIAASAEWRGVINEHIRDCSVFVVFVTRNSMDSHEVIKECTYAINLHKKLHIIYLESVPDSFISPNLIADFTNNQRVHAHEMHSSVFEKRLREPLTVCKKETEQEDAGAEKKTEKKASGAYSESSGYSTLVKAFKKAQPSYLWSMARMIILLAAAVAITVALAVHKTEATGGMIFLVNLLALLCLIPLIFRARKAKYCNSAVISHEKLQNGMTSETVYTAICRVAFAAWAVLFYTIVATAFEWLDSWISVIWPLFLITIITEFASILFSVVSHCILTPMLTGKKEVRTTALVWHVFFLVSEIMNVIKVAIVLLSGFIVYNAGAYDKMFAPRDYMTSRITDVKNDAYVIICISIFTIIARGIMILHEKAVFKQGKALVNGK